jgi:hypothetical protein
MMFVSECAAQYVKFGGKEKKKKKKDAALMVVVFDIVSVTVAILAQSVIFYM